MSAPNETIAYVDDLGTVVANTLVWVDRQGREEPLGADPDAYFHPRLSPDGKRVAVAVATNEGGANIWLWDLAGRVRTQLTDPGFAPVWTRDSRHLLYFGGNEGLMMQPADGMGTARRIASGLPSFVTSDGRVIFSAGGRDISILSLDGPPGEARLVSNEAAAERNAVVSPNGRWLAYESNEEGPFDIYVRPFPDVSKGLRKVSTTGAGGTRPLWSPGGDELFYVAPDDTIMGVRVDPSATSWSARGPVKILEGPYATTGAGSSRTYDIAKDGRFLLVKRSAAQSATPQIVVIQNWLEELKRLVPVR
jgi:serine/threonine-protein kinase